MPRLGNLSFGPHGRVSGRSQKVMCMEFSKYNNKMISKKKSENLLLFGACFIPLILLAIYHLGRLVGSFMYHFP